MGKRKKEFKFFFRSFLMASIFADQYFFDVWDCYFLKSQRCHFQYEDGYNDNYWYKALWKYVVFYILLHTVKSLCKSVCRPSSTVQSVLFRGEDWHNGYTGSYQRKGCIAMPKSWVSGVAVDLWSSHTICITLHWL